VTDRGADPGRTPVLRVLSAGATDEEIAAILTVIVTAATARADRSSRTPDDGTTSMWSGHRSRQRTVRGWASPGPAGWRTSYWPR
jgi:hypothetical protein